MTKPRLVAKWTLGLLLFVAASPSFGATFITTMPSWDGSQSVASFGVPNTQTYGQILTVPAGETSLTSFSFQINPQGNVITFLGEVYAWDSVNNHATGAALYESGTMTTVANANFQPFTFTIPGGAAVTAGQQIVIFASTSKSVQTAGVGRWGIGGNVYGGGNFVFINNGANAAAWTTSTWSTFGQDLAFTAGFGGATSAGIQDVPTLSATMLMVLAAALAVAGAFALRFRHG